MSNKQIDNQNNHSSLIKESNSDFLNNLKNWFNYYKSKSKIIIYLTLFGALIGLSIAIIEKPIFKAVLTFAMEEDKGSGNGLSGALGLASSLGIDLGSNVPGGGGAFAANNLAVLMKSKLIVEKVLLDTYIINGYKTTLADYYLSFSRLKTKWASNKRLKNIKFPINSNPEKLSLTQDSALSIIYKKLIQQGSLDIYQKDKKVTIITIEVNSSNEIFSKLFCEALANETSKFYIQTKSKKARINTELLQKQADSVKATLYNNINSVANEADKVFNLNPSVNSKGINSKKVQVDVTANTEILKQIVVQLELSKITLRKETPLIQLIDRPKYPLEKDQDEYYYLTYSLFGMLYGLFTVLFFLFLNVYFIKIKIYFK
jgi:hypothetical protein